MNLKNCWQVKINNYKEFELVVRNGKKRMF